MAAARSRAGPARALALAALVLSACAPVPRRGAGPLLDDVRLVDLSHPFDEDTIYWPTSPSSFELTELARGVTDGGWYYAANAFCTPEHGGTHLDAPIHFGAGRQTADAIPVERLVGPGVVIDVSRAAADDPGHVLAVSEVLDWEARHGRVPAGALVLLRTGWSDRWGDRRAYLGDDTPGDASRLRFPSFGADAARLLVHGRGVAGLGVDTASIDAGSSTDFPVHRLAAAAEVFGLENLTRLDELPPSGATIIALPMKIAGGSGAPVRVVAALPRSR